MHDNALAMMMAAVSVFVVLSPSLVGHEAAVNVSTDDAAGPGAAAPATPEIYDPRAIVQEFLQILLPASSRHFYCYLESSDEQDTLWARFDIPESDLATLTGASPLFPRWSDLRVAPGRSAALPVTRQPLYFWEVPDAANLRSASRKGASGSTLWQTFVAVGHSDTSFMRVHLVHIRSHDPRSLIRANQHLFVQMPTSTFAVKYHVESFDAGWTSGGHVALLRFELRPPEFEKFWGQLLPIPGFSQWSDINRSAEGMGWPNIRLPWWDPCEAFGQQAAGTEGPARSYGGSCVPRNRSLAVCARQMKADLLRVYMVISDQTPRVDPREEIWRRLGSDLPASAHDVQRWDAEGMGNVFFAARFDLSPGDLKSFLAGSTRLPRPAELGRDPQRQAEFRRWGRSCKIAWWDLDELQDPVWGWGRKHRGTGNPNNIRDQIEYSIELCSGRVAEGLLRVYVRFYSGD
jgi:hypothetical protein